MIRLALALLGCWSWASAHAEMVAVEYEEGHVTYSSSCPGQYAFAYFDGRRLQFPCIGSSETITHAKFLLTSRLGDCEWQVRVNHGMVEDGVLYATDIQPIDACGGGPQIFP